MSVDTRGPLTKDEILTRRALGSLRDRLQAFGEYPAHTLPIDEEIERTAFFPGGSGLWKEEDDLPRWPSGRVMILGQDFDSEVSYRKSMARGKEELKGGTWLHLVALLNAVGVSPTDCFFTNFFMGVRKGEKATGRHPDAGNESFVERCRQFLLFQIEIQRPKVILVLGGVVPEMLAPLSPELAAWHRCRSFAQIDRCAPLVRNATFPLADGPYAASVAVLTHPSYRRLNVHRRRYGGLAGDAAERKLIADALRPDER